MYNVILKSCFYKDIDFFTHVYVLDTNYCFNEKNVEEILNFVKKEPFFDVMIHVNDLTHDIIELINKISEIKNIWLQSDKLLFEDFAVKSKETLKILAFDKIKVMIDALGDVIDVPKTLQQDKCVIYAYVPLPF